MRANTFRPTPSKAPTQLNSTGTADPKSLALDAKTQAVLVTVKTNSAYFTIDGTTPDATHGLELATGVVHFIPVGAGGLTLKFASSAGAAASLVNVIELV